MTNGPELIPSAPLLRRQGRPVGRVVLSHDPQRPDDPALFEWELRSEEWSDEHDFDEFVYVLDGEVCIRTSVSEVLAVAGDLVRVPGGVRGSYSASQYARLLSVYGPRSSELGDARGVLRPASVTCVGRRQDVGAPAQT